jgi:hypothetical protein
MPQQSILRDREAVSQAVSKSQSIAEALQLLGLRPAGGNYRALHQACARFGLAVPVYQRPASSTSRLPVSNGSPALIRATPPDELRQPASLPAIRVPGWLEFAVIAMTGVSGGTALALAIRDGSRVALAEAAAVCMLMVLAVVT